MKDVFTVGIMLKPYVHKYLINHFGDPVNLYMKDGSDLKNFMIELLRKPSYKREKRITLNYQNQETRFIISKSDFYRYGWEITKSDMIRFNNKVEALVKFYSRSYIAFDKSLGIPISTSIRTFQNEFGFDEDIWPYESIKKDFDRHGAYIKFDKVSVFKENIKKIFIDQLSEFRQPA